MPTSPILLIPGLNCTAEIFAPQVNALWPHGPVMVASHLAGDSIADMAASILATAPPRFGLLGFSLGGYIAFEILRRAPQRIERLCLLDTTARPDTREATLRRRIAMGRTRAGDFEAAVISGFPMNVHPDHADDAGLRALLLRMAATNGPEVYLRQQEAIIARADSRGDLPLIRVPTWVIVGDADEITVPEAAAEMAAGIPGARLVVIPKAGHMAVAEQPEVVSAALVEWVAR